MKGALLNADLVFGAKRSDLKDVETYDFKHEVKDYKVYWDVRKGLIPIVGGARETGITSVSYDFVIFSIHRLLSFLIPPAAFRMCNAISGVSSVCGEIALKACVHLVCC